MNTNRILTGLAIISTIVAICYIVRCGNDKTPNYAALTDSLTKVTDAQGREIASTQVLVTDYRTAIALLKVKGDSLSIELAKAIGKKTSSATGITTNTHDTVFAKADTFFYDKTDTSKHFPIYSYKYKDIWANFDLLAKKDTCEINYSIKNQLIITQQDEARWWQKSRMIVNVKNLNPHSSSVAVISYQPEIKQPKRLKWLGAGVVVGVIVGKVLLK